MGRRWPSPTASTPSAIDLWRDGAGRACPTDAQGRPGPRARAGGRRRATRASPACASPSYGDGSGEAAVATSTGIAVVGPLDVLPPVGAGPGRRRRRDQDRLRRVGRARAGRRRPRRGRRRRRRPGHPACSARSKPASGAVTLVLEPRMAATLLGVVAGTLNGESVLKGRSPFADRVGEADRLAAAHARRRPDRPRVARRRQPRRRGPGHPPQRRSIEGGVLQGFLHNTLHRPPRRRAVDRLGRARLPLDARASARRPWPSTPGAGDARRAARRRRPRRCSCSR